MEGFGQRDLNRDSPTRVRPGHLRAPLLHVAGVLRVRPLLALGLRLGFLATIDFLEVLLTFLRPLYPSRCCSPS